MKQWVLFAGHITTIIVLEAMTCRLSLYPITFFLGFFFGWTLVTHAYPEERGRMTVRGDLFLAVTVVVVILGATLSAGLMCRIAPQVASCVDDIGKAGMICAFAFAMSIGLSSFTLWLWFRLRQLRENRSGTPLHTEE